MFNCKCIDCGKEKSYATREQALFYGWHVYVENEDTCPICVIKILKGASS